MSPKDKRGLFFFFFFGRCHFCTTTITPRVTLCFYEGKKKKVKTLSRRNDRTPKKYIVVVVVVALVPGIICIYATFTARAGGRDKRAQIKASHFISLNCLILYKKNFSKTKKIQEQKTKIVKFIFVFFFI